MCIIFFIQIYLSSLLGDFLISSDFWTWNLWFILNDFYWPSNNFQERFLLTRTKTATSMVPLRQLNIFERFLFDFTHFSEKKKTKTTIKLLLGPLIMRSRSKIASYFVSFFVVSQAKLNSFSDFWNDWA